MNKLMTMAIVVLGTGAAWANCGNGPVGAGNGCNGGGNTTVTNVTNITNVNNVNNVTNTGVVNNLTDNKIDPRMNEAKFGIDTALRLYDGKRVQLQAYNVWSPSMHSSEDVIGDGRNLQYGIRFVFKIGSSYEERLLAKQESQIKALEAMLSRISQ